ncbi:MAG: calcium-translocating P-type ATPase, PMCA-type [Bacteroidales bacterium]|nr:calcium-translocating P-type ATPase, PMCA-type [Bacteroidales bacterium]
MAFFYNQQVDEVISGLKSSASAGLTFHEASVRLGKFGPNQLTSKRRKPFIKMLFEQFKSFMIIILLIAAVISGVVGVTEGEGMLDTFVIMGILLLNAFIGAIQERKAESSLEALKNLAAPYSKVLRDSAVKEVRTRDLVPGDIVILETGFIVPADLRIIEAVNLKIQESALTGESVPVIKTSETIAEKDVALGDRKNMAFSGSMVTYGRGKGVVTETGMNTQVGKIADMLQQTVDTETPMTRRLEQLGKILGISALIICALIFLVGILYGNPVMSMFMTAVSLAVAAIPEGLPAVSTVVLAIGVQRLVKRNAIVRTLPSVETLGSATVICSDKTGTLTQNKMTVVETYVNHNRKRIDPVSSLKEADNEEKKLLTIAILCADAQVAANSDGSYNFTGDPTETALLGLGIVYRLTKNELEKEYPRVAEIPFDSERKRMTTVNRFSTGIFQVNVKGGIEEVLGVCSKILQKGEVKDITEEDRKKIRTVNEEMAGSALRLLAMAYKELPEAPVKAETGSLENNLVFAGLVGMIDPARPEAFEAVKKCSTAGIKPVIITGDHKITAVAIASQLGILNEGDLAITGNELEQLTDEELFENVNRYSVYARVAPEHKVKIVKAWQKRKEIVAMTGDGVNDAPALKQADIGAAMGIVGTDVAKGAADIILTDDNFATIVSAVEEGRRIYDNILKVIQFLLSTNVGEIFLLLTASVFNLGAPLLPIHILWVNLVTDSLPALALSVDPAEKDIMNRKPRNTKQGLLTRGMIWRIVYQGIMIGLLPLVAFLKGLNDEGLALGQTMAFATLVFAQMVHIRNLHSNTKSSLAISPFKNKPLIGAILASSAMALFVLLVEPVRTAFRFTEMDGQHWLMVLALSFVPIVIVDLFKLFKINGTRKEF